MRRENVSPAIMAEIRHIPPARVTILAPGEHLRMLLSTIAGLLGYRLKPKVHRNLQRNDGMDRDYRYPRLSMDKLAY
jgi:hypothetical protein